MFGKKTSERMLVKKIWDYVVEMKKKFMLRKRQVYPLLREERKDIYEFILKKLRKEYIRLLKLSQTVSVFEKQ